MKFKKKHLMSKCGETSLSLQDCHTKSQASQDFSGTGMEPRSNNHSLNGMFGVLAENVSCEHVEHHLIVTRKQYRLVQTLWEIKTNAVTTTGESSSGVSPLNVPTDVSGDAHSSHHVSYHRQREHHRIVDTGHLDITAGGSGNNSGVKVENFSAHSSEPTHQSDNHSELSHARFRTSTFVLVGNGVTQTAESRQQQATRSEAIGEFHSNGTPSDQPDNLTAHFPSGEKQSICSTRTHTEKRLALSTDPNNGSEANVHQHHQSTWSALDGINFQSDSKREVISTTRVAAAEEQQVSSEQSKLSLRATDQHLRSVLDAGTHPGTSEDGRVSAAQNISFEDQHTHSAHATDIKHRTLTPGTTFRRIACIGPSETRIVGSPKESLHETTRNQIRLIRTAEVNPDQVLQSDGASKRADTNKVLTQTLKQETVTQHSSKEGDKLISSDSGVTMTNAPEAIAATSSWYIENGDFYDSSSDWETISEHSEFPSENETQTEDSDSSDEVEGQSSDSDSETETDTDESDAPNDTQSEASCSSSDAEDGYSNSNIVFKHFMYLEYCHVATVDVATRGRNIRKTKRLRKIRTNRTRHKCSQLKLPKSKRRRSKHSRFKFYGASTCKVHEPKVLKPKVRRSNVRKTNFPGIKVSVRKRPRVKLARPSKCKTNRKSQSHRHKVSKNEPRTKTRSSGKIAKVPLRCTRNCHSKTKPTKNSARKSISRRPKVNRKVHAGPHKSQSSKPHRSPSKAHKPTKCRPKLQKSTKKCHSARPKSTSACRGMTQKACKNTTKSKRKPHTRKSHAKPPAHKSVQTPATHRSKVCKPATPKCQAKTPICKKGKRR